MAIESVGDLVEKAYENPGYWWRGQASASEKWKLRSAVHRKNLSIETERSLVVQFIQRAGTRHEPCPDPADYAGWLFLMQ